MLQKRSLFTGQPWRWYGLTLVRAVKGSRAPPPEPQPAAAAHVRASGQQAALRDATQPGAFLPLQAATGAPPTLQRDRGHQIGPSMCKRRMRRPFAQRPRQLVTAAAAAAAKPQPTNGIKTPKSLPPKTPKKRTSWWLYRVGGIMSESPLVDLS